MTRWLPLFALLLCLLLPAAQAHAAADGTTISGADLVHPIRITAADEVTFMRRINLPPELDEAPPVSGPSYVVTTRYWDDVLHGRTEGDGHADADATYYPEGGFVKTRQDGADVWIVIDLRQQAILNRYVRLGRTGALPERPSAIQLLVASADEPISVTIGSHPLTDAERIAFWQAFSQPLEPVLSAGVGSAPRSSDGVWISFNLPEGRELQLFYDLAANRVIDDAAGEAVIVPKDWLQPVLGANAPHAGAPGLVGAKQVPQESSPGSGLWWLVMIGGGLGCIAAAVWLRRRWA